jgi:endonuclease G
MKKTIFVLSLFFSQISLSAQKVDSIISTSIYTSYFSFTTHTPLFVKYKLFHGGGKCSRTKLKFRDNQSLLIANNYDYKKSGYDIGHLASAEDFAFDCSKQAETFEFYNTLPQTANLNRGSWKKIEFVVREQSLKDSLLIICGGLQFDSCKTTGKMLVPKKCFKIIKNLKTKSVSCLVFDNNDKSESLPTKLNDLYKLFDYDYSIIPNLLK